MPALALPALSAAAGSPRRQMGGGLEVTDRGGRLLRICPGLKFSGHTFEPCKVLKAFCCS